MELLLDPKAEGAARALFADGIVVEFYMQGQSGEVTRYETLQEVVDWIERLPVEHVAFTLLEEVSCPPHPRLPEGERSVRARYRLEMPDSTFENEGEWTFHIIEERIVGIEAKPDDLPEDAVYMPKPRQEEG